MPTTTHRPQPRQLGKPVWELAEHFPPQGHWDESDYLALDSLVEDARSIELVDGQLEFLQVPTKMHELIVAFLYDALRAFVRGKKLGEVFFSGRRVKLWNLRIRAPDIVFLLAEHKTRSEDDYSIGADLVVEVVSPSKDDHQRDYKKRRDYARAGISEYWIVDPQEQIITVFRLNGTKYEIDGKYKKGERATSFLLLGFEVDVSEALAGMKQ